MTDSAALRLFVATKLPDALGDAIEGIAKPLRNRLPRGSWLRPHSVHLTLAFLGDQPGSIVAPLGSSLSSSVAAVDAFEANVSGSGFFPDARRPRVGWLGLTPEERFRELAHAVRETLEREGVDYDRKPFTPHLTVVRARERWSRSDAETFERAFSELRTPPFRLPEVILFSSELRPEGAVHTARATARLG
ncbi:MAG: RNA 2',3'-cyclic phosphodiesterase [Thermoanaerobaculia bacterium]